MSETERERLEREYREAEAASLAASLAALRANNALARIRAEIVEAERVAQAWVGRVSVARLALLRCLAALDGEPEPFGVKRSEPAAEWRCSGCGETTVPPSLWCPKHAPPGGIRVPTPLCDRFQDPNRSGEWVRDWCPEDRCARSTQAEGWCADSKCSERVTLRG